MRTAEQYAKYIGALLDQLGFTIPSDQRVPGSPALQEAWQHFALMNAINLQHYPIPNEMALSPKHLELLAAIQVEDEQALAAQKAANIHQNKVSRQETYMAITRYIREGEFHDSIIEQTEQFQEKISSKIGAVPAVDPIVLMSDDQRQRVLNRARRHAMKIFPTLSNNPSAK